MLEPVTFFGGEGTDRLVDPYFFKLLMESVVRHYQLHKSAQHRITRMLMEICECAHREPFQQHPWQLELSQMITNDVGTKAQPLHRDDGKFVMDFRGMLDTQIGTIWAMEQFSASIGATR